MKNIVFWCLAILLVCTVAWMANKTIDKIKATNKVAEKTSMLHEMPLFSLDSSNFVLPQDQTPTVLILFNSECEHCQYEASQIKKSVQAFSKTFVLMVSSESLTIIKAFSSKYGLNVQSNISFCKINAGDVFETFGSGSIPRIFIYGKDRKLVKEFRGETKIEAILKLIP